ncbi:hypothetical protein GGR54DRAFT_644197 [Hypoxylon sp. NC1633]|nr:hypothetical protein GGR54DRAFT_644197 [Hypoxylon sp. NC1633]
MIHGVDTTIAIEPTTNSIIKNRSLPIAPIVNPCRLTHHLIPIALSQMEMLSNTDSFPLYEFAAREKWDDWQAAFKKRFPWRASTDNDKLLAKVEEFEPEGTKGSMLQEDVCRPQGAMKRTAALRREYLTGSMDVRKFVIQYAADSALPKEMPQQ